MKKRVLYFDILKIVAIVFVILIHVISEYWDSLNINSGSFIILSILESISRFCVPIYFMVSGALFLSDEKKITFKDILKKYVPRILLLFVFWNLLYSFLSVIITKDVITLKMVGKVLLNTLLGEGIFHLYFLPIIIGFYLCVPLIKKITVKENKELLKYFIIILFIFFGFERLLEYLFNISISYQLLFGGYLIYFILGYYLSTFEISKKETNIIYILGILGFIITLGFTIVFSKAKGITDVFLKYDTFNVIMYSSCVFLFAKNYFNKFNDKLLNVLSKTNFGVYLIHGLVLGLLEYIGLFDKLPIVLSIVLNCAIIYIVSTICVYILIKTPIIKRLVSLERR